MADDINISYSFQSDSAAAAPEDQTLIAFTNCERVDLGPMGTLLINRNNGRQTIVAHEVATALTYCTTFQPLAEHARVLTTTIPQLQGQLENVIQVLKSVREAGLMLKATEILGRLQQSTEQTSPAPTRVFAITCDRPAAVERLLDSLLRIGNLGGHDELVLVDDSRDPANAERNREAVARFNLSSAKTLRYVGAAAQQQLLDSLIAAMPEQETGIRFLIDRQRWAEQPTYGLARNICLLLSVGYRAIVMDDDILCQAVRSPASQAGLAFGSILNREAYFFGDEQALMQHAAPADGDALTGIAKGLGSPLARLADSMQSGPIAAGSLQGANAAFIDTLRADSRILASQCGSWGDPGTGDSHWLLHLDPYSVGRMLDAPGGLSATLENRLCGLSHSRTTVSKTAVMSQLTGLDNSALLPPYFPAFRGEDALFASMLAWVHPRSAVINHNWAVPHLPLENRSDRGARAPIAAQGGLGTAARYLSDQIDFSQAGSEEARLAQLADELRSLAEAPAEWLSTAFRAELAREHTDQMQLIGRQQGIAPQLESRNWEAYLQRAGQEVQQALVESQHLKQIWQADAQLSEAEAAQQTQQACKLFADALQGWASVRESSRGIALQLLQSAG